MLLFSTYIQKKSQRDGAENFQNLTLKVEGFHSCMLKVAIYQVTQNVRF